MADEKEEFWNSTEHSLAYLKDLEIEVCRSMNFEFFVHNPLSNIQYMKNILLDFFRANEDEYFNTEEGELKGSQIADQISDPQNECPYAHAFTLAKEYSFKQLFEIELLFCFTPNYIALASLHLAFHYKNLDNCFLLSKLHELLGLPGINCDVSDQKEAGQESSLVD